MPLFGRSSSDADAPIVPFGSRDGRDERERGAMGRLRLEREWFEAARLTPFGSRIGKLIFFIIFTVFWNGITSVFVVIAVRSWMKGSPEWFLTFFIIPFVLIGLVMVGVTIHSFLGLLNPQPILELPRRVVQLGDDLSIAWRFSKRPHKVSTFLIELIATESATYRRGTDTVTDTETIHRIEVYRADRAAEVAQTSAEVTIPADAMSSFAADRNKIEWKIRVHGEIPRWPDIDDAYPVYVTPGPPSEFRET